jgi:hypothetical protein
MSIRRTIAVWMNDKEWDRMKKILAKYDISQSNFSRRALLNHMEDYPLRIRTVKPHRVVTRFAK